MSERKAKKIESVDDIEDGRWRLLIKTLMEIRDELRGLKNAYEIANPYRFERNIEYIVSHKSAAYVLCRAEPSHIGFFE